MYGLAVKESLDRTLKKLARRDPERLRAIERKVAQILEDPRAFKPLRAPMQGLRRVHIGPFVLTYEIDEAANVVTLVDFEHHDKVYR